jgi:hypothetical protein
MSANRSLLRLQPATGSELAIDRVRTSSHRPARSRIPLGPLIEVAAVAATVLAVRAYRQVRNWGADAADLVRELPGDELVPEVAFTRTRAINIDADPDLVWRWLMRSGRPVGGWLRGRWMGQFDGLALTVAAADPPHALVLRQRGSEWWDVTWAFVIIEEPQGRSRLLVRTRASHRPGMIGRLPFIAFRMLDPVTVAVARRMLLDIKYHAEAARLEPSTS